MESRLDVGSLETLPGVAECIIIGKPYKLVSREFSKEDTVLRIATPSGEVAFGGLQRFLARNLQARI